MAQGADPDLIRTSHYLLSESDLLRKRIANNIGIAGDQELNVLAFNQNVVVTVPGNTRFYIVLQNSPAMRRGVTQRSAVAFTGAQGSNLPTLDELRQLMQLKQKLSTMYQRGSPSSRATKPLEQQHAR